MQLMYMTGTHEQSGAIGTLINPNSDNLSSPLVSLNFQHVCRLTSAFIFQLMQIRHETSFKTNDIVLHLLSLTVKPVLSGHRGEGGGWGVFSYTSHISMCHPNGQ